MKESLTQTLSQRLQQRLSPVQMRLVRMLEMTEPEVEEEVRRELDENPALEQVEREPDETETFGESADELQRADYRDDDEIPVAKSSYFEGRDFSDYEGPVAVADPPSMMESLTNQLSETDIPAEDLPIAQYIIGNLDDNGYLTRSLPEISEDLAFTAGIEVEAQRLDSIFERVRSLDPAGIGARDLRDCLLLQLKRLSPTQEVQVATKIVDECFDLFSLRHYSRIENILGIEHDEMIKAREIIQSLNPKPAGGLEESAADEKSRHIIPDFIVDSDPDGHISVSIPNNIPELAVEESFRADYTPPGLSGADTKSASEALGFISRRRGQAEEFIELLRLRQSTLMRVARAIVSIQHEFFKTEDESDLKPMTLKDISSIVGLDVSVISRATSTKYLATPRGVYPLKFFFSSGVAHITEEDGETVASAKSVLAAVRKLIEEEPSDKPYTDDELCEILNRQGFGLKRRTVAKYRDRLGFPVARLRRNI